MHLQHLGHPIANDHLYLQENPPKRSREGVNADTAAKSVRIPSNPCLVGQVEGSVQASTTMTGAGHIPTYLELENSDTDFVKGDKHLSDSRDFVEEMVARCSIRDVSLDPRKTLLNADGCRENATLGDGSTESFMSKEGASDLIGNTEESFSVDMMCTHCPHLGPSR